MITVREAVELIKNEAKDISLAYSGGLIDSFNWKNPITLDVYGDYFIDRIDAINEGQFELNLAVQVIKKTTA